MEWWQSLITPAVLVAITGFGWRLLRATRTDAQHSESAARTDMQHLETRLIEAINAVRTDVRTDVQELRRDVASIDKRLVAVETLLHERTAPVRPAVLPARDPAPVTG